MFHTKLDGRRLGLPDEKVHRPKYELFDWDKRSPQRNGVHGHDDRIGASSRYRRRHDGHSDAGSTRYRARAGVPSRGSERLGRPSGIPLRTARGQWAPVRSEHDHILQVVRHRRRNRSAGIKKP